MQLSEGQVEQLLECRRRMLHEVGILIGDWDRLWKELQVRYLIHITSECDTPMSKSPKGISCLSRESIGSLEWSTK